MSINVPLRSTAYRVQFKQVISSQDLGLIVDDLENIEAAVGAGGITSINGLSVSVQTFATGSSGTNFGIVSAGSAHTFNLPDASALNRGLLTPANFTSFSSKSALQIARYVYLVQDSSDQTRMGGAPSNVYITAQDAYDNANSLQIALDISSPATAPNQIIIMVGEVMASVVGDIVLSADWNPNVAINGIDRNNSSIGNIIADNDSGNGFSVIPYQINTIGIGDISSNSNFLNGNGGAISLYGNSYKAANVTSSATIGDGDGGSISISGGESQALIISVAGNGFGSGSGSNITVDFANVAGSITSNGGSSGTNGTITIGSSNTSIRTSVGDIDVINNSVATGGSTSISNSVVANINQTTNDTGFINGVTMVNTIKTGSFTRAQTSSGGFNGWVLINVANNNLTKNFFDITGAATINMTSVGIENGVVDKRIELTSANPTESITTLSNMPSLWPIRLFPQSPLVTTFVTGGSIVCAGNVNAVIDGSAGDWIEFTLINGISFETARGSY